MLLKSQLTQISPWYNTMASSKVSASGEISMSARLESLFTLERVLWLLATVLFLIAWNRGLHLMYAMFSFLISVLVISYVGAWWQLRGLQVSLRLPVESFKGQPVSNAQVVVHVTRPHYFLSARVVDQNGVLQQEPVASFQEVKNESGQPIQLSFSLRGVHQFHKVEVVSCFPFGIIQLSKFIEIEPVECVVYPKVWPLRQLPEQYLLGSQVDGDIPQHLNKGNDDFAMVRTYRDGDEMRHMHWRMSAKHNEWIVKEFDSTKMPAMVVILNGNPDWVSNNEFNPREHMLEVVASLAEKCAQEGCSLLVLLGEGQQYLVKPFQRDLQPLLYALATWQGSEPLQLDQLPKQIQDYPLVIRFSASHESEEAQLPLMNYQHQVNICFDRDSYPNFGVRAGVRTEQKNRETIIKVSSSSDLWGMF